MKCTLKLDDIPTHILLMHTQTPTETPVLSSFTVSDDGAESPAQSQTVVVVSGSLVILSCGAFGIPRPELTWTKDGGTVSGDSVSTTTSGSYNISGTLTIGSAAVEDGGTYVCHVTNRAGSVTGSTQLQVLGE